MLRSLWLRTPLSANMSETPTLPEFSGEGGERIVDGNDGCYAIIPLAGGSEVIGCYRVKTVYLKAGN